MTITNGDSVAKMLVDPTIVRLYEYTNVLSGQQAWAAFEAPRDDDTSTSPFVLNRILLKSEDKEGVYLTREGVAFLDGKSLQVARKK